MKVFATIPLLATLLATATADSVRGARELKEHTGSGDAATTKPPQREVPVSASTVTSWKFPQVKLTQANVKFPSIGVPYGAGIAAVQLYYDSAAVLANRRKVCIQTNVLGFIPGQLKIYRATITASGSAPYVDFNSLLKDDSPTFSGCRYVNTTTFNDMKDNSEMFYVEADVAASPYALSRRGIRGQLLQRLSTDVNIDENVAEYEIELDASGDVTMSLEAAGTTLCIDATIEGFDPLVCHFHKGDYGKNGVRIADLSTLRVSPGRYLGCASFSALGISNNQLGAEFHESPSSYYIQFHGTKSGGGRFNDVVRGQFGD